MTDVIVAGGGPAGLATAIFATLRGMSVTIIEPQPGVIDKACGEGLMPAARALLGELGAETGAGREFVGVRYHRNGRTAVGRFKAGSGLGIRRTDLSEALWFRADALGVERRQGWVRRVECHRDYVEVDGAKARWLVGADGLNSTVREALGIPLAQDRRGRFGVRRHFETDDATDFVEVYLGDSDEAYVTPVGKGEVGVAVLSTTPKRFEEGLAGFPALMERLGEPLGNVRGAGPFRRFAASVSKGRAVLVGDAAGFYDPITGEGLRLAFEAAELAVDCMNMDRLDRYEAGWRRIVRDYRWLTSGLLALRRNSYSRDAIVPVLKIAPILFDGMLGLLGGR